MAILARKRRRSARAFGYHGAHELQASGRCPAPAINFVGDPLRCYVTLYLDHFRALP